MKLLAVSLQKVKGELQLRYKFFNVAKETSTAYRLEKPHELLANRVMIRKDEVDKVMFKASEERRDCKECDFEYINLSAWVLVEGDKPDYELLRCWRKFLKDTAVEQLRTRNKIIKEMYNQVVNL